MQLGSVDSADRTSGKRMGLLLLVSQEIYTALGSIRGIAADPSAPAVGFGEVLRIVEPFNGTVRQDSDDYYGDNYLQAERAIARLIDEYNDVRLHAALGYLEPRELHYGNPDGSSDETN